MMRPAAVAALAVFLCAALAAAAPIEAAEQAPPPAVDTAVSKFVGSYASFMSGFSSSFWLILATEIGDKTFFIAIVLAMRHSRRAVLLGALSALFGMTILSAVVGQLFTVIPTLYTHIAVILLLIYFGIALLREGMERDGSGEEYKKLEEEVVHDLASMSQKKHDGDGESADSHAVAGSADQAHHHPPALTFYAVFVQALTLTFLAEWGDRSQIATIALATTNPVVSIIVGGCAGHFMATSAAVLAGRIVKTYASEKMVALVGGGAFLFFAVLTFLRGPN
eukprot:TRINITY_DN11219_c0_g1_i1.p1 TRINITY_DN11219_c0_g1~~TRINITY_DN11219_c0_g1_i1.p1  ORF type:complete len:280 (-),score=91.67 TRINITY_DN11219_c0_g1_i1:33-872(-)